MKYTIRLIILFLFFNNTAVQAQTARKYSNEFLAIGVGARALGMSGSFITAADDATSGYWNPAGLTGIQSKFQERSCTLPILETLHNMTLVH